MVGIQADRAFDWAKAAYHFPPRGEALASRVRRK